MDISELKKIIESDKAIFGLNQTLEALKKKKVEKVLVSSNCPEELKVQLSKLKADIENSDKTNMELGVLCKKFFNISVIGIKK